MLQHIIMQHLGMHNIFGDHGPSQQLYFFLVISAWVVNLFTWTFWAFA